MLFGRKTPPAGSPRHAGTAPARADETDRNAASPSAHPPAAAATPEATSSHAMPSSPSAPAPTYRSPYADKGPDMTTSTPKPPHAPTLSGAGLRNDTPRRLVDVPGQTPRRAETAAPPAGDQQRRLTVGRDISLSGEITSCDVLVVEGTVEAKLRDGRSIEIAETGLFKGSVEIDEADIGGRFEGDIVVRGRLRVRSTGRIHGSIRYGELEVEAGGRLVGEIQTVDAPPAGRATDDSAGQWRPVDTTVGAVMTGAAD